MKRSLLIGTATAIIVIGLIVIALMRLISLRASDGNKIADDIAQLDSIFNHINQTSGILGFEEQQNPINFLTVSTFTGAQVGSMKLAYPDKWEGPYVEHTPQVQDKEYMVVQAKDGYFITPGNGVLLPNGKVVGKDVMLTTNISVVPMVEQGGNLSFQDRPLAAPMKLCIKGENVNIADLEE
jgi:hypothetical protein